MSELMTQEEQGGTSSAFPDNPILVVDDETAVLRLTCRILESGGIGHVLQCDDSRAVMDCLESVHVEAMLLDLNMPHLSGKDLLQKIGERFPEVPVIVVTGTNEVATAVECMRLGAFDYLVKPVEPSRMIASVRRAIELRELRRENDSLRGRMQRRTIAVPEAFAPVVTRNSTMMAIFGYVETIATSPKPVLVTGETGVGKELIARAVHDLSGRHGKFVAVNMGGLDDQMFSDTLFGHVRGAFTGADRTREGLIESASGGTLFLDEIGDLNAVSQTKLLRLLQQQEFYPLGSDTPKRSDARIVAATNQDLFALQENGTFRKDLYYRLQIHKVELPPLRDRLDDLPLLIDHFVEKAAEELGKTVPDVSSKVYTYLGQFSFPGNIRELESLLFEAVGQLNGAELSVESFRSPAASDPGHEDLAPVNEDIPFNLCSRLPTLREAADQLVQEAMRRSEGKQTTAARLLGISQPALSKRLKGIND